MHILLFAKSVRNSAGIERMTVSLANELSIRGHMVSLVVCGSDKGSFYTLDENVFVYALEVPYRNRLKAACRLRPLIKKIRPDIFINMAVAMGQISFLSLLFLKHRPKVITCEHFHLHAGSRLGYYYRFLSAFLSDYTVVLTDCDKKQYPEFLQKRILRIYNFTTLFPQYYRRGIERKVLTIGRLEYQKGYDLLLPIWKIVANNIADCELVIIGDGRMKENLLNMINELELKKSVRIIPPSSNVVDYYKKNSIYVMTSRFEGLPMVLIEAKMCGMACISYDCPNGPNEIIRNADDGYVVPFGNTQLFAKYLMELLLNPQSQKCFGAKAVDDAQKRFSSKTVIKQWEDLFNYLHNK